MVVKTPLDLVARLVVVEGFAAVATVFDSDGAATVLGFFVRPPARGFFDVATGTTATRASMGVMGAGETSGASGKIRVDDSGMGMEGFMGMTV